MRDSIRRDVDLSNPTAKRELLTELGAFGGLYEVRAEPRKLTRSTQANRYWWSCPVKAYRDYKIRQGEPLTLEDAHDELKLLFLPPRIRCHPLTGEVIGTLPADSHTLSTEQFSDLIENVVTWMEAELNVFLPERPQAAEGRQQTRRQQPAPEMN